MTFEQIQQDLADKQYGKDAQPILINLPQEKTADRLGDIQVLIRVNS